MKSFKLPIGLTSYTVRFKKVVTYKNDPAFGFCDYTAKQIEVCTEVAQDVILTTFLHECLHAIFYELGHPLKAGNEALVEGMAIHLARAVRALPEDLK